MAKHRRHRSGRPRKVDVQRRFCGKVKDAPNPGPTPEALAHGGVVGCDSTTRPGALGRLFRAGAITENEQRIGEAFRRLLWSWRRQAGVRWPWILHYPSSPCQIIWTDDEVTDHWRKTCTWLRVALRALYAQPQEVRTAVDRVILNDALPAYHHELAALRVGLTILATCLPGV